MSEELPRDALTQLTSLKLSGVHVLLSAPQPGSSSAQRVLPMLQRLVLSECEVPVAVLELLQQALTRASLAPVNRMRAPGCH